MIIFGLIFTVVIPFVPLVYFLSAVIGWLVLAIEAMFAMPIAVIMLIAPARQSIFIGSNHNIILTLLGVLLRPFFIVAGLVATYVLARVGLDFVNVVFSGVMSMIAPEADVANIFKFLAAVVVYIIVVFYMMLHLCGLIAGLGDYALGWIGVGMSTLVKANPAENMQRILPGGRDVPGRNLGAGTLGRLGTGKGAQAKGQEGREWISAKAGGLAGRLTGPRNR